MGLNNIAGYGKQVKRLSAVLDIVNCTDKYCVFDTALPKSLLLYGEIDVGKTFIARSFLDDCQRNVFEITDACDSAKKLKKIFKNAKKYAPSVVFIDEIDCCSEQMISAINKETEAVSGEDVFFVATFDVTEARPVSYLFPLRFDYQIEFLDAEFDDNCRIIDVVLADKKLSSNFNFEDMYYFAQDRTAEKLERAYSFAAAVAVYEGCESVTNDHFVKAFLELDKTPLANEYDRVTAYHEAGHAAVNMLMGGIPAYILLFGNDEGVFFTKRTVDKTFEDKKRRYLTSLGGKACEEVLLKSCSTGSYADLNKASKLLENDLSALASVGFEYYDSTECESYGYNDKLAQKVQQELQKYYDKAKQLIEQNSSLVIEITERLKEKHYLLHSELTQIYADYLKKNKICR